MKFDIKQLGLFHGFFGYFEMKLSDSVCMTNIPFPDSEAGWGPLYFPIDVSF